MFSAFLNARQKQWVEGVSWQRSQRIISVEVGGTWDFQVPPAPGTSLLPQTVSGEGTSSVAAMRKRSELSETWGWPGGEWSKKQRVYLNVGLFNHAVSPDALRFAHCSWSAAWLWNVTGNTVLLLRRSLCRNQEQEESSSCFDGGLGSDEWGQGAALQSQDTE